MLPGPQTPDALSGALESIALLLEAVKEAV